VSFRFSRFFAAISLIAITQFTRAQGPAPFPSPSAGPLPPSAKVNPSRSAPHELTRADLEAFLDALIASQIENRNIAGVVVGAVKDGQVLLTKGYGYADFGNKKPVSSGETLFRPGSISKLFTATAVMQLVEQGRVDLDRNVNDYLDFTIAQRYAEPITLRRLLTHTAGFEETLKNLFVSDAKSMRPLRDYLVSAMPARIYPPGKVPSYSNYGLSIAGYIVQRMSGEKFEDYVAAHILKPLKMEHSTFAQPLPESLAREMSNGYIAATEKPRPFEFVQAAPAGALSATADDMGRFMLAFLGNGTLEGATILQPGTVEQMEARQFEVHPALNSVGLALMEYTMNGFKAWGHGGDTICFHSDLWFVPDAKFGFFISYNSAAQRPGGGRGEVLRALFDRYFPAGQEVEEKIDNATAAKDMHDATGTYINTRRAETTLWKVVSLLDQAVVKRNAGGTISVTDSKNLRGQTKRWREFAPLVFREVDGPDRIAFRRNANGRVTKMLTQPPVWEWQRAPWYESKSFVFPVMILCISIIALTALLWPIAALVRWRYARPPIVDERERRIFRATRWLCVVEVGWLLSFLILFSRAGTDVALLGDGVNPWLIALRVIGWIIAIGAIYSLAIAVSFWRAKPLSLWAKIHTTLIGVASIILTLFLWHVHLLDASLKF
jgi:CubicO group peptidase (beta-lactamase class C family)